MTNLEIAFQNFKSDYFNLTEEQHNEVLKHISVSLEAYEKHGGKADDEQIYRTMVTCSRMLKYIPS